MIDDDDCVWSSFEKSMKFLIGFKSLGFVFFSCFFSNAKISYIQNRASASDVIGKNSLIARGNWDRADCTILLLYFSLPLSNLPLWQKKSDTLSESRHPHKKSWWTKDVRGDLRKINTCNGSPWTAMASRVRSFLSRFKSLWFSFVTGGGKRRTSCLISARRSGRHSC